MSTTPVEYSLQRAKDDAVTELLRPYGNIVGIGIGKKWCNGEEVDCIRVYVIKKLDECDLPFRSVVKPDYHGIPTAVIPVGRFGRKVHAPKTAPNTAPGPGSRIRVKTDAPNVNEGAKGTLGAVVRDHRDNQYILSCNHLLAVNGRVPEESQVVSAEIVGREDVIATRNAFVKLHHDSANQRNEVDCALALLHPDGGVDSRFPDRFPRPTADPGRSTPGMKVRKLGAMTGDTSGDIIDTNVDLYMDYGFGMFRFENQIVIEGNVELFATAGDSGSIVVDMRTRQATGMIFGASGRFAVACPLQTALASLAERIDTPRLELLA